MSLTELNIGPILSPDSTALFICDVQERFRDRIAGMSHVINTTKLLSQIAPLLEIPLVILTEQYPKAMGNTVSEVTQIIKKISEQANSKTRISIFEKRKFSMMTAEVVSELKACQKVKNVVLVGIEAHVCILQTCYELVTLGYKVFLVADGISSQRMMDRKYAFEHATSISNEIKLCTAESIIFLMMGTADFKNFKEISKMLKDNATLIEERIEIDRIPSSNL